MSRKSPSVRLLMAFALLACVPQPGRTANRVSNTVTHATFETLSAALAALTDDGQILVIDPGVYLEPELMIQYAVTLQGAGAAGTIIEPSPTPGTAASRVATVDIPLEFAVELPVIIEHLTLRHGNAAGDGGALYVREGTVVVRHCVITANQANGAGGGLFCWPGTDAELIVEDSTLLDNLAGTTGGGVMRGIVRRSTLAGNQATDGGATAYTGVEQSTLSNNVALAQGGGMFRGGAQRCILRDNAAQFGGGAFHAPLSNSLVLDNAAGQSGGGLYAGAATNCTIVRNTAATTGGGLWGAAAVNTILFENQAPIGADYDAASTLSHSRADPLPAGDGNIDGYPFFRDPDGADFALLSYSPCVDAGDDDAASGALDLPGNDRMRGAAVDIGAYETNPAITDLEGFERWLERHGLPIDPPGQFAQDHDGDGIPNGLAFSFGWNRVDGRLLTLRQTLAGTVAETAVRAPESIGFVAVKVVTAGGLIPAPTWTDAEPVGGAPPGAQRYRRDAPDAPQRGFFRLEAALLP